MTLPDFTDILRARKSLAPYLRPTPLYHYQSISDLLNAEAWVKHENHLPTGAFKVRGAVNFAATLSPDALARGIHTASSGNLRAGTAYAAHRFGLRAVVNLPGSVSPARIAMVEEWGRKSG